MTHDRTDDWDDPTLCDPNEPVGPLITPAGEDDPDRDEDEAPLRALTSEEVRAITSLTRLAARWPRTLRLASMGGSLVVVLSDDARFLSDDPGTRQAAVVADITGIPNTGGDW